MNMPSSSNPKIFLAQVLPFDASQDTEWYTYRVPEMLLNDIVVGQMVEIPLRDALVQGIVAHLTEISSQVDISEIKEIRAILIMTPLVHAHQIQAMLGYAEKHAIHIHKVVSLFLPAPIRNRVLKYGLEMTDTDIPWASLWAHILPELVFFPNSEEALQETVKLLEQSGIAVITPSDIFTEKVLEMCAKNREELGIFDARMTETARSKFWIQVLLKKYTSVIWTRRLVTYNLQQFHTIVFLEDTLFRELLHSFHRYHTLEILLGCLLPNQKLLIYSSTPSIETMSLALAKKINFSTRS